MSHKYVVRYLANMDSQCERAASIMDIQESNIEKWKTSLHLLECSKRSVL